jgi:hypothetical protein
MNTAMRLNPQRHVRLAALCYLAIIALGLYGELVVRGSLIVPGDAAATAARIAASPQLWRSGIVGDLLMQVLDLPVIVVFYLLLRPVSESLALTSSGLNLIQTAVLAANRTQLLTPLILQTDASQPFSPAQQEALTRLAINAHADGFAIGLLFFGFTCVIQGWLFWRCGFLPRVLGLLLGVAGLCYLVNSFALLLLPSLADALFPAVLMPAFVGESALALWLLIRGVDVGRWHACLRRQVPAASG